MKKLLLLFISVLCLGLGAYAEEQLTINFNSTDLGKTDKGYVNPAFNFTKGGITFTINNVNPSNGQIQANKDPKNAQAFILYNTTALPNIKKVEITFKSVGSNTPNNMYFAVGDAAMDKTISTGATGTWNDTDKIATWTSTEGKSFFRFNINKNVNGTVIVTKMVITYGEDATTAPEAPVISFGETTCTTGETYDIEYGAEVTVSSKDAESIIANSPVEAEAEAEHTGNSYKFEISKSGDYTFKGKNKVGESATTTVTFNVKKPVGSGIEYVIVSSEDQLVAGEYYAIASLTAKKAMSTVSDYSARQSVDVNIIEGKFDQTDDVLNFVLGGEKDAWTLKTTNYSGKNTGLSFTSDDTALKIGANATTCAIAIAENGDAMITLPNAKQGRRIKLSGTNFKFYAATHSDTANIQIYRETVVAPTIEVDGEKISTVGSVDVKVGSVIRIIGHEANELYYIHNTNSTANRAPVANTEGWTKHDSNIYEYTVPADFATKHITITAKGVKNGKESAPVSITLHNGSTTGIEGVESAENDAEVEWFTITGVRVQQPAEGGLYIRRQGSEVSKVRF